MCIRDSNKSMEYMDLYSKHTLLGQIYNIEQNEQLRSKYWNHNLRTAFEDVYKRQVLMNDLNRLCFIMQKRSLSRLRSEHTR